MKGTFKVNERNVTVDFSQPIDISMPLSSNPKNASAWYVDPVEIEAVRTDNFIGSVAEGGSVNFRDINFNPHGNGTHTECVGHISMENYSINRGLSQFVFWAQLISIEPRRVNEDYIIELDQIKTFNILKSTTAIVLRTLPNDDFKKQKQYSNTNPPYLGQGVMEYLIEQGVDHFLIDLPSVDREFDNGVLRAHHAFWEYPSNTNTFRTITELIYVPNGIHDGEYLLNIQIAPFENDASPSKPVLYRIEK